MQKEIMIKSPIEMMNLGYEIGANLQPNMVIALEGDLGAGKTTFTKGLAKALGIEGIVNSPTFVIMKIYSGRLTLYHLDVYRTNSDEFELSEYFENDGVCVVEWAENISSLLPDGCLHLMINDLGNNIRKVNLYWEDSWYNQVIEGISYE